MAIESFGYAGTITDVQWAFLAERVGGAAYGVTQSGAWLVTTVPGVDRRVSVAAGSGWGHGIYDISDAPVTLDLDSLTSGVRWDVVAMRRTWDPGVGGTSTFIKDNGTAALGFTASRQTDPGNVDDQPVAFVQVTGDSGGGAITQVRPCRVWSQNRGMYAEDPLALLYLEPFLGTQVVVRETDGTTWDYARIKDTTGAAVWNSRRRWPAGTGTLSLLNGWAVPNGETPTLERREGRVDVSGTIHQASSWNQHIATLPDGYRPTRLRRFTFAAVNSNNSDGPRGFIEYRTNGEVIAGIASGSPTLTQASYIFLSHSFQHA